MNDTTVSQLASVRALLDSTSPRTMWGVALPSEVRRVREALQEATRLLYEIEAVATGLPAPQRLDEYRAEIDRFNAGRPNVALLDAIRAYNHSTIDVLNAIRPLRGNRVLDVGASPHGYALERALELGAASYVGIGLDVDAPITVRGPAGRGELRHADAEALPFADGSFGLIVSMSTFEHVAHVDRVLGEMYRVLAPGGQALVTFEPIWTCSYGHHLHHFGAVAACVPDWSHLVWTKAEMADALADVWPSHDPSLTLEAAVSWVYDGPAINRLGIREMLACFDRSPFRIEFVQPLKDGERDPARLALVSRTLGLTEDELMTKGLSVLLRRP